MTKGRLYQSKESLANWGSLSASEDSRSHDCSPPTPYPQAGFALIPPTLH